MNTDDDLRQRIERHERFLALDSTNPHLAAALGDLYHQAGQLEQAAECYERAIAHDPGRAVLRSALANVRISQHRFAEAEALLAALVATGDNDPAVLHNLGVSLFFQHRYEEARDHFLHACERGLELPMNNAYLARSLHQLGALAEATIACERWRQISDEPAARSLLALLKADAGHVAEAVALARSALGDDPTDAQAHAVLGLASLDALDIGAAREHFEDSLEHDPAQGRAWLGLGLALMHDDELVLAVPALEQAASLYPGNAAVLTALGWARLLTDNLRSAIATLKQALHCDERHAEAHAALAVAHFLTGETRTGEQHLRRARQLDPASQGAQIAQAVQAGLDGDNVASATAVAGLLAGLNTGVGLQLIERLTPHLPDPAQQPPHRLLH